MTNNESNAVILARVSSKAQEDEGYSLDAQLKLLTSYCERNTLNVVKVFKIAETASKEQSRKVFHELLGYINRAGIYHLAVEKTDRLTRNFRDAVAIDDWLERDERRRLHAVKENILLHKDAKSDVKFMWNIHLAVAKKYTDNLREEAMKGWTEKLSQGWLPSFPPPGYMTITQNGKRIHVPDPKTSCLLQQAFELYLEPSQTLATVAEAMAKMGISTRKGRPFYKSQVQRILTNPFYIGINRFDGKDYPGAQEPIISKELFDRVQNKMRRKLPSRYRKHNPTFKNLITCSDCGGLVTWQLQKGKYYGACQRKSQACLGRKLLRQDQLEEIIVSMLRDLVSPSNEVVDWVAEAMHDRHVKNIEENNKLAASIQSQLDRLNRMENNLYDDKLSGEITPKKYDEKCSELRTEKAGLETRLSKIDQTLGQRLQQQLVLLELSQKAAAIFTKRSPEQKRLIITKLFEKMTYKDGCVSVKYTNFARAIAQNVKLTHEIIGGAK